MRDYDREDRDPDYFGDEDDYDNEFDDDSNEDEADGSDSSEDHEDDEGKKEKEKYHRISFTIPKDMEKKVKKFAHDVNLSVSELIRGSLDGIMALSDVGVDLGKQIEFGLKEGLKGLEEGLKDIDFEQFENIDFDVDLKTEEYEKKMEDYERKMEEYAKKMEENAKKMGEKAKKIVESNLPHINFPHIRRIRPPKAPRAPRPPEWPSTEPWREPRQPEDIRAQEQERAKARAPLEKIKMLKELLDEGMITQEDYDEKKKKILEDF